MPATGQCIYELGVASARLNYCLRTCWISSLLAESLYYLKCYGPESSIITQRYCSSKGKKTKRVHQLGSLQGASWLYPAEIALVHAGWKESYRKHQWKAQLLVVLAFFLQPGWLEEAAQKLTGSFRCHVWCITVCWKDESLCSTSFLTLLLSSDSSASDHQSLPWTHFLYLEIGSLAVRQCSISSTGLYLVESSDVEWWPTRYVSAWNLISHYSD